MKTVSLLLSAMFYCASAAMAQSGPNDRMTLESFKYNGTACLPTAPTPLSVKISNFPRRIVITLPPVTIRVGPEVPLGEHRASCVVEMNLKAPMGYRYTFQSPGLEGVAQMDQDANLNLRLDYFFAGGHSTTTTSRNFAGPYNGVAKTTRTIQWQEQVWSPSTSCFGKSATLVVDLRMTLYKRRPEAKGSFSSGAPTLTPKLAIVLEPCDGGTPSHPIDPAQG